MHKTVFIGIVVFLTVGTVFSQVGIGGGGGLFHGGIYSSDQSGSRFKPGWGYEFFIRHDVFDISESLTGDVRYGYRYYKSTIELPYVLETWFKFKYLTVDLLGEMAGSEPLNWYFGLGCSLVSVNAEKDFFQYTKTIFIPEILLGGKWQLNSSYTIFSELSFYYGTLNDVLEESIPITGIRFILGATMFLTKVEE